MYQKLLWFWLCYYFSAASLPHYFIAAVVAVCIWATKLYWISWMGFIGWNMVFYIPTIFCSARQCKNDLLLKNVVAFVYISNIFSCPPFQACCQNEWASKCPQLLSSEMMTRAFCSAFLNQAATIKWSVSVNMGRAESLPKTIGLEIPAARWSRHFFFYLLSLPRIFLPVSIWIYMTHDYWVRSKLDRIIIRAHL